MSVLTRERGASRLAEPTERAPRERPAPVPAVGPAAPADARRLGWPGGRYGVVYRHEGSRALFGIAWFLAGAAAIGIAGSTGSVSVLAGLYGFVAALAGYQATSRWRQVGIGANRVLAAGGALAVAFAAMASPGLVGVVVLALVALSIVDGAMSRADEFKRAAVELAAPPERKPCRGRKKEEQDPAHQPFVLRRKRPRAKNAPRAMNTRGAIHKTLPAPCNGGR